MFERSGRLIGLVASVLVVAVAATAVFLMLPPRQTSEVAVPAPGATPEEVVTAYLGALTAHDCDTAEALTTLGAKDNAVSWCKDVASLSAVHVRPHSDERPKWSGRSPTEQVSNVPVSGEMSSTTHTTDRSYRRDGRDIPIGMGCLCNPHKVNTGDGPRGRVRKSDVAVIIAMVAIVGGHLRGGALDEKVAAKLAATFLEAEILDRDPDGRLPSAGRVAVALDNLIERLRFALGSTDPSLRQGRKRLRTSCASLPRRRPSDASSSSRRTQLRCSWKLPLERPAGCSMPSTRN